jgi:acetyl esterase/lipase
LEVLSDERYGEGPDALLDIVHPPGDDQALPVVVWIHGGGWVGGSKDELRGYLKLIAIRGYVVVAPRYSLAPEHRYPTPLRQVMEVLAHVQANAEPYGADPSRIVIAGDSAGAQLTAQTSGSTTPATAIGSAPASG